MKRFFTIFFVILGVIFFILILIGGCLYMVDPFHLKSLFMGTDATNSTSAEVIDRNPALDASQERALDVVGIDPAQVPTKFTPEQQACFVEVLGTARVAEITDGAMPTAGELYKAKGCL